MVCGYKLSKPGLNRFVNKSYSLPYNMVLNMK